MHTSLAPRSWLISVIAASLLSCSQLNPLAPARPAVTAGTDTTAPVIGTLRAPRMLLSSSTGGSGQLGALTAFPLGGGAATDFHTFAGTPWLDETQADGHGLVWNARDARFYGVLNGGGAYRTGVVVRFDPSTDQLVMLKTLSGRVYPDRTGLNGELLPFDKLGGFFLKPLPTLDGKGLLLLSNWGGVDGRGLLVYLDIDPASPRYLEETVVYDFFDYELGQHSYCQSLRGNGPQGQTELAWGKAPSGADVVFLARSGVAYTPATTTDPTKPGNCHPSTWQGASLDKIMGRMFALQPTDPADPSKPWAYALGYVSEDRSGVSIDPLLSLGRQLYWDPTQQAVRWSTENPGGGELEFFEAGGASGSTLYRGSTSGCLRLNGLLPLDGRGTTLATCSGVYAGTAVPASDVAPGLFQLSRRGVFTEQVSFGNWTAEPRFIHGTATSPDAHRVFVNGGSVDDECFQSPLGCTTPSTIEEVDPNNDYRRTVLVTGDSATTGRFFFGDPAVGGAATEPVAARYLVWFGAEVDGHSNTLNKYDRSTGQTVSIPLDPTAGAHPTGKLLDLGDGRALGSLDRSPPERGATERGLPGGYGGTWALPGSLPGDFLLDLSTGEVLATFPGQPVRDRSVEPVRLDDGSVWEAGSFDELRTVAKLNLSSGATASLASKTEAWNYSPIDPFTLAGRKSVLYLPFWDSSVAPASKHFANVTLGCARADDGALAESAPFGPAQSALGNAHRIVYGATYSPLNDAMYLATAMVGDADRGTIFEVDKGVADADLCREKPVVTAIVSGLTDVPSTKPLSTRAGALYYGTANGKLMRLDAAARTVSLVAEVRSANAPSSQIRGYLAETADGLVTAVVYDRDLAGKNTARRLVTVDVSTGAVTSRDVTAVIDESEPYPGVLWLR